MRDWSAPPLERERSIAALHELLEEVLSSSAGRLVLVGEPLEEARGLAHGTGELQRIAPAAAATAEACWLARDNAAVKQVTDSALLLAWSLHVPWVVGELAYWRRQAGMREQLPAAMLAGSTDWLSRVTGRRQRRCG